MNKDSYNESTPRVRVAESGERDWFDGQLAEHHYLGAGRPVGDTLRQIVEVHGRPAALLVWGPACYALKDRDQWIGWSANHRIERLKLIVQNRRFLVLSQKGSSPNLASQTMGAALRVLPGQWKQSFGYRPLLAETFTDPEAYAGTCYKASNWQPVGASAGFSRHRADFYVPNESPKKLWLYELGAQARKHLLAGRRDISEIARFAQTLSQAQRHHLGLPKKKGAKAFWQVPTYSVFYQVLTRMDSECFARLLDEWLLKQAGSLPQALALDGKMIRERIGILTLAQHEDGAPCSVAVYDQKKDTARCEMTAAAALLKSQPSLDGKTITADPLHCQKSNAAAIVEKGGDYLFQVKGNQPALLRQAEALDASKGTPFF